MGMQREYMKWKEEQRLLSLISALLSASTSFFSDSLHWLFCFCLHVMTVQSFLSSFWILREITIDPKIYLDWLAGIKHYYFVCIESESLGENSSWRTFNKVILISETRDVLNRSLLWKNSSYLCMCIWFYLS